MYNCTCTGCVHIMPRTHYENVRVEEGLVGVKLLLRIYDKKDNCYLSALASYTHSFSLCFSLFVSLSLSSFSLSPSPSFSLSPSLSTSHDYCTPLKTSFTCTLCLISKAPTCLGRMGEEGDKKGMAAGTISIISSFSSSWIREGGERERREKGERRKSGEREEKGEREESDRRKREEREGGREREVKGGREREKEKERETHTDSESAQRLSILITQYTISSPSLSSSSFHSSRHDGH